MAFFKIVLALALCVVVSSQTTVNTQYGPVTGASSSGVRRFLKIPFAAPPVGSLRWRPPQSPASWTTPFDSTVAPIGCADFTKAAGATVEDCLYLSVYSPASIASGTLLPVMVWIHGGTFQSGSATQAPFNFAPQIVTLSGFKVIVVSIQYRLNAYGFLASESLRGRNSDGSVGTYGLQDQQFALNWVKNNIAAFGGDASRVTVFGESAGSSLIATHLVAPGSAGLFQQAIMQSGPLGDWNAQPLSLSEKNFNKLVAASPCASATDTIACLEGLTVDQINAAVKSFTPAQPTSLPVIWEPAVDGVSIPAAPAVMARAGQWSNLVPVIIGTNKDEGSVFVINSISPFATQSDFLVWANKTFLPMVGTVASAYYSTGGYPSPFWAAERMFADSQFVCPTRRTARWISAAKVPNPPSVYTYQFTRTPSSGSPSVQFLGSYHSAELTFVFNAFPVLNAAEVVLSQAMVAYWTNFAITGNPNGANTPVNWPKYSQAQDQNLVLDTAISVQTGLKRSQCDFWDALDNLLTNAGPANCEVFQVYNATTTTSTRQNSGKNKCVCTIYV